MSLKVAIFEDDKDLADALKEMLTLQAFETVTCYNIREPHWREVDVVVADFRNKIVSFKELRQECATEGLPLIAISGAETDHAFQLLKPFTTDELKKTIFQSLVHAQEVGLTRKKASLVSTITGWLKG